MVYLVRHAMPAYGPSVPADRWPLTAEGRAAAAALAVPAGAYLVASDEVKAYETLEPFGTVERDPRFREVDRVGEPWDGPFRELRAAYVDGTEHEGWEARGAVVARFAAAVAEHTVRAAGRPVVIGTHGMAMTLWLTATVGLPDPVAFWTGLGLPDLLAVDPATGAVTRQR